MNEWLRFGVTALLLTASLFLFVSEVIGVMRFGYVLNRMHAAGIGDTLALLLAVLALTAAHGPGLDSMKMFLLVLFMWLTSPTATHFLSQIEYYSSADLYGRVRRRKEENRGK